MNTSLKNKKKLNALDPRLTKAYKSFFEELSNSERYQTFSVSEFYIDRNKSPLKNKVNVILRIDVDEGFHLSVPLAKALNFYKLKSSHFFLTHPSRYYQIWNSKIPKEVLDLGHEVGLHTDHMYEQIINKTDGLSQLKNDIKKLSDLIKKPIRGVVHHGHPEIEKFNSSNFDLFKNLTPKHLNLDYHEGYKSVYIKKGSLYWEPECDLFFSDYLGFSNSWGWNYFPSYPLNFLKNAQPGDVIHIGFHTTGAFKYWENWTEKYGEKIKPKESWFSFLKKCILIRIRISFLKRKSLKHLFAVGIIKLTSIFLAKIVGLLFVKPKTSTPDTWEYSRKKIFDVGIPIWRKHLDDLGLLTDGGIALEIGSGNGQWLIALAEEFDEVIGIEPLKPIREFSKKKICEYPKLSSKIKIVEASAENIPVKDGYVDTILCAGVFMFTEQKKTIAEISRILKKGGKVCITANGQGYFWKYIIDGFKYKSYEKMRYGIEGLVFTWKKWLTGKETKGWATSVSIREMKNIFKKNDLNLIHCENWLPPDSNCSKSYLGFPTCFAFIAKKQSQK